jgi:hypothetical protein
VLDRRRKRGEFAYMSAVLELVRRVRKKNMARGNYLIHSSG